MKYDNLEIIRAGQKIILPRDVMEAIDSEKMFITVNRVVRSYGIYHEVKVCKKEGGKRVLCISLARYILGLPKFKHADHIDRNPLNNCRSNLRPISRSLNRANSVKSAKTKYKYKGVSQYCRGGNFRATARCDGVVYTAGPFKTVLEAAKGYDVLARAAFGEHAALNFPLT